MHDSIKRLIKSKLNKLNKLNDNMEIIVLPYDRYFYDYKEELKDTKALKEFYITMREIIETTKDLVKIIEEAERISEIFSAKIEKDKNEANN